MKTEKTCTKCKELKPLSMYSSQSKALDGKQSICKPCYAKIARDRRIGKPCYTCGKPKEIGIPKGARICLECAKTCYTCKTNPRRMQNRECKECYAKREKIRSATPHRKKQERITRIKHKYKVSREYAIQLSNAESCEACKSPVSGKAAQVDHCHKTGVVRGVLCFGCNVALGNISDSKERLQMLIDYLSKHEGKQNG